MQYQLEEERQQIAQFRYNIERQKTELDAREDKLVEIQQLAPSVKELQTYGITFDLILPFLIAVNEKCVLQNMNQKDAAFEIAQVIRKYHQLDAIDRCIQQAEQRLKGLDAFSAINNQAITVLMNLKLNGYSEKDIIDLARWNKHHQLGNPGNGDGNGSSSSSNNDGGVGNGGNKFKLDSELNLPRNNNNLFL